MSALFKHPLEELLQIRWLYEVHPAKEPSGCRGRFDNDVSASKMSCYNSKVIHQEASEAFLLVFGLKDECPDL